jgi:hypothetical protein
VSYGVLVAEGKARWIGRGAEHPKLAGGVLVILGLAALGVGVDRLDPEHPWMVLTVPATVTVGLWFLQQAWLGKRSWLYRAGAEDYESGHDYASQPWWLVRAGCWMFGLFWPLLVLLALGVDIGD